MNYFDILLQMKTGKKVPYSKSYFDTLFAAKLAEMQIKTLTGTLPLVFRTSETALRSWTIYGNNTPHIAQQTSVLPLTFATVEDELRDWAIYGNDESYQLFPDSVGLSEITAQTTDILAKNIGTIHLTAGVYTIHRYQKDTLTSDVRNVMLYTAGGSTVYEDGATTENRCLAAGWYSWTFTLMQEEDYYFKWWAHTPSTEVTSTNFILTKGETQAPSSYIPYQQGVGQLVNDHYEIPLSVNGSTVNLTIGNAPLTAGQSISKTSTGVDIATAVGENTISTTLYNKPETAISYVDYVGVGEKSGNNWQIPLTISDGTNTTTVNVPIDAPLTEGESVTDTQTISTFTGENTIDTSLTNKPEMTITYKGG